MNMPCPCRVDCPGTDSPFANLTSEAPDQLIFIGYSWGNNLPNIGWNFGDPINNPAFCDSPVSQQEADLCAGRVQVGCLVGDCGPGGSGPTIPWSDQNNNTIDTFLNAAAFCTVFCQDGLPFTYTVRAGLFRSFSQVKADEIAISYACQLANLNAVCFGSISGACLGQNYLSVISVTGGFAPYTIVRIGGTLPPGVGFVQDTGTTAFLSGIPTATGAFTFTVRAVDTKGNFMQKDFTCYVLDISNKTTLPLPAVGTFYNQQLLGTGGVAPYSFSNPVGLPGGLTLQSNGFVVGNPIAPIGTGFTCTMTDSVGNSCAVAVAYGGCSSIFGNLVWNSPFDVFLTPSLGGDSYTFAQTFPAGNAVEANGTCTLIAIDQPLTVSNGAPVTIPNTGITCKLRINVKSASGTTAYAVGIVDPPQTNVYFTTGSVPNPPVGITDYTFTIPAGVTQILLHYTIQCGLAFPTASGALDLRVDFGV